MSGTDAKFKAERDNLRSSCFEFWIDFMIDGIQLVIKMKLFLLRRAEVP